MRKTFPRTNSLNNPEKKIPDNIIEEFFLELKSANIDSIRKFIIEHKIKLNLIEKNRTDDSGKTPYHVILELDSKVASDDVKLEILIFLDQMGAPMDLPDSSNIWPIHLAIASQSTKIINFFIEKKVSLNRKDSSNNTPLHYAIFGKEIPCQTSVSVGLLAPEQSFDKIPLNKGLDELNKKMINFINDDLQTKNDTLHIINTIINIPTICADRSIITNINKIIADMFVEESFDESYPSKLSGKSNSMTVSQQQKIEQIIDQVISEYKREVLLELADPTTIAPNAGEWGPLIPTTVITSCNPMNPPNGCRQPLDIEKILDRTVENRYDAVEDHYRQLREIFTSTEKFNEFFPLTELLESIKTIVQTIDSKYLDFIIFNETQETTHVSLSKFLCILAINLYISDYGNILVNKIMNMRMMNDVGFIAIRGYNNTVAPAPPIHNSGGNQIYGSTLTDILGSPALPKSETDTIIRTYITGNPGFNNCIRNNIARDFTINYEAPHNPLPLIKPKNINTFTNMLIEKIKENNIYDKIFETHKNLGPIDLKQSWTVNFNNVLTKIRPAPTFLVAPINNFFYNDPTNTTALNHTNKTIFPGVNVDGTSRTIFDMIRIFYMIDQYVTTENYNIILYPPIFDTPVNNWNEYVDTIGNSIYFNTTIVRESINKKYPEYIFLYKLFITYAQNKIKKSIGACINNILSDIKINGGVHPDIRIQRLHKLLNLSLSDSLIFALLIPRQISDDALTILYYTQESDINKNYGNPEIKKIMDMIFNNFDNILFIEELVSEIYKINPGINIMLYISRLLEDIRVFVASKFDYFETILNTNNTVKILSRQLNNYINSFNNITNTIKLNNEATIIIVNQEELFHKRMHNIYFFTDIYSYYYIRIKKKIHKIIQELYIINDIFMDISIYYMNEFYYYIPQICLPVLIKYLGILIYKLIRIRAFINEIDIDFSNILEVDTEMARNETIVNIKNLGKDFCSYIRSQLGPLYGKIIMITDCHNIIANIFNQRNLLSIVNLRNNNTTVNNFLTGSVIKIKDLPTSFDSITNMNFFVDILDSYKIDQMTYYANPMNWFPFYMFETDPSRERINPILPSLLPLLIPPYEISLINYRNIMSMTRSGQDSHIGGGIGNRQINLHQRNVGTVNDPELNGFFEPVGAIAGRWLNFDVNNPRNTTYFDACIGYQENTYTFNWADGMPNVLSDGVFLRLMFTKQTIIKNTLQKIIDNHYKIDANKDKKLEDIYTIADDISKNSEYNNLNDVRIYVIIGKIIDGILNNIIEYAARYSASIFVYSHIVNNPKIKPIIDNNIIDIIQKNFYEKISLKSVDKNTIENLLLLDPKYVNSQLLQIESDPNNINYVPSSTDKEFMHYLYNINYHINNTKNNKKCYSVNTKIIPQLINADTINFKNSDGNTPLHIAVNMNHQKIIKLLMEKGGKIVGFTNNQNKSPWDIGLLNIEKHINYTKGLTVIDTINNFVTSFNSLLISRLKDEKFNNNIVKHISYGIPIYLLIFNHTIHLHVENYRYGFTSDFKKSIVDLIKKYHNVSVPIYPIDIFDINNNTELKKIAEPYDIENRIIKSINDVNIKKIDSIKKQIEQLQIQLDGIVIEKKTEKNPDQIAFLDQINSNLTTKITNLKNKLTDIQPNKEITVTSGTIDYYQYVFQFIQKKIINRSFEAVDFYNEAFNRIGKTKELYIRIWDNYIKKRLSKSSTTILSIMNNIASIIISNIKIDPRKISNRNEMNILLSFYKNVNDYIEEKKSYPNNLLENPILSLEVDQIIYLINLIITPVIQNILLNQVYQSISEMLIVSDIGNNKNKILDTIINTTYNGNTLDSFIEKILPRMAYKFYTGIYNDATDIDRKINSSSDLFMPIIQIVKEIKIVQIVDDSPIIQNLKNYLIPFMGNTYQNFIHHLQLAKYSYEIYLSGTYQFIMVTDQLLKGFT